MGKVLQESPSDTSTYTQHMQDVPRRSTTSSELLMCIQFMSFIVGDKKILKEIMETFVMQ